jgi:pimeloyl-ACP methyl ester carboxylesterase
MHASFLGRADAFPIVFGHGWARDHKDFIPAAELLAETARIVMIDFPGFGKSLHPGAAWTTQDYALATREYLHRELGITRFIWVGHSFGGRVGLRLGQVPDSPVEQLFIVAGAGVKRSSTLAERVRSRWRGWRFQRLKAQVRSDAELIELEKKFGSRDYVHSREIGLRDIFNKTVQEDQSLLVPSIKCPTTLLYGGRDTETPPEIGKILHRLIPSSTYVECPEFDHHNILSRGRHQLALMLREAIAGCQA